MKVLVIDDDLLARESARATIEEMGHEVVTIDSALGASGVIMRERPTVALVDVDMPALRGTAWLEMIQERKSLTGEETPLFLLFSGLSNEELARLVEPTGASGYVSKQDGPEAIRRELDRIRRA